MAPLTSSPQSALLTPRPGASATVCIEPPRNLFELRLREVWAYRELLYFFVWRDVKIRYKQTAIGILWVILQPVLNMLGFTLFFGELARLLSDGLPYPVFYFAALIMSAVIDGFRWAVTARGQAPGLLLLVSASAVVLVLLGGVFFFNRMETMADRV